MRIKSINIKNYRQYKQLAFQFNKIKAIENDMNIIIASNGVGKSNFLNAITWCLYEEESHLQDKYKALPIVNLDTISNTNDKYEIDVIVEMCIDVDGEEQIVQRKATYIKNEKSPNKVVQKGGAFLIFKKQMFDPSLGYKKPCIVSGAEAKFLIEKLFPKGISEYFFFDNEQMNNYFTSNKGGSIQKAINSITKIDLVQAVNQRLRFALNEYKVNMSENKALDRIREESEQIQKLIEEETKEFQDVKDQIKKAEQVLENISIEIKGAENLKELERRRLDALNQRDNLQKDLLDINDELDHFIVKYTTLINMYPAFVKTLELIQQKDKDRQLPPDINIEVLKRSVDSNTCEMCGNDLDKEHLGIILEKLERYQLSNPSFELLLGIRHHVRDLINKTKQFKSKKMKLLNKQEEKQQLLDSIEKQIIFYDNEMKNVADKDILLKKLDQRDTLNHTVKNLYSLRGTIEAALKRDRGTAKQLESDYDKELQKTEKNNAKAKKFHAVKSLLNILEDVEKEIIQEIRDEISKQTFDNFSNLIWKDNTYINIKIDEDYNVDLIHKRGLSAIGSTSAAERSLLALSFTNAIHKVSGFESPIVIDSPVGRVSDENRRKFAETLSEISKTKQIIMLFTPDEYSNDISSVFDGVAIKSYASMDNSEEITSIGGKE